MSIPYRHRRILRRVGIVPQESDEGSDECAEEYYQFLRLRDIHYVEVRRIAYMTRHVRQYSQGYTDDGTVAGTHAVHAVVEV